MDEEYWSAVSTLRLRLAGLLESLTVEEWSAPSLCRGWRIRDVAGHVAIVPTISTWRLISTAPRARFDLNRVNTLVALSEGSRPPDHIVRKLRDSASVQRTAKALDVRNSLFDVIVHSQDIAVPLGRDFPIQVDDTRRALQRVWEMGWPFKARKKLAGLTLHATDTDWRVGTGPQVRGPALALLLLLTGRTSTAVGQLRGPGVEAVALN